MQDQADARPTALCLHKSAPRNQGIGDADSTVETTTSTPSTLHGWSSPAFPDELKLLCLKIYWCLVCPGLQADESTHAKLVECHLVPLVQALGAIAMEAYYKTMGFHLTVSKGEHPGHLRYPVHGNWVRSLRVTCEITIRPHFKPTVPDTLGFWLRTPLRWLLRSKKTLGPADIDYKHREKLLLDNDIETRWQAEFPNLKIFNPTIHVHKEICRERQCLRNNKRCTTGCMQGRNLTGLREALENAELGIKAKYTTIGLIVDCAPRDPELLQLRRDWAAGTDAEKEQVVQRLDKWCPSCKCERAILTRLLPLGHAATFWKGSSVLRKVPPVDPSQDLLWIVPFESSGTG